MYKYISLLAILMACFSLAACDVDEGGPEEIGENMEEMATDVGNSIEDACEEAKDGMGAKDSDC